MSSSHAAVEVDPSVARGSAGGGPWPAVIRACLGYLPPESIFERQALHGSGPCIAEPT